MTIDNPETSGGEVSYYPETREILDRLTDDATIGFECIHRDGRAVGIYETPEGCVAFADTTQPLCGQHVVNGGDIAGMFPVVDLSVDAAWSKMQRDQPDYWMSKDPESGAITMVKFSDKPF